MPPPRSSSPATATPPVPGWKWRWTALGCLGLSLLARAEIGPHSASAAAEFFENRIRPAFVEHCASCHAGDDKPVKGGLRLDSRAGWQAGGKSGLPAIVPGDPEASPLIRAIRHADPDRQMPPKKKLPSGVIADFEAWIRDGAFDPRTNRAGTASVAVAAPSASDSRNHWAFQPPRIPPIPKVRDRSWVRTPVDAFVLARLEAAGLRPSPEADRRTLIRRATYDLHGLPPTAAEVEAFVTDPSSDAYPRLINRLLASPRYGERWGRYWLDVARYSDTKGYVYYYEESRFVHPHAYRDWVISSFNDDLPYDRFLQLQIAGDLLLPEITEAEPPATHPGTSTLRWPPPVHPPAVGALGFLALGRRFLDLEPDIIDDRIDVLMRGTQGLTVGCARCHDHKFDPVPTRDYYSLYGIFLGSEERLVALQQPDAPAPDPAFVEGLRSRTDALEKKYAAAAAEVTERLRHRVKDYLLAVVDTARLPSDANVRPTPEDINPFNVRQWERFLGTRTNATDPVFKVWHAFARLKPEDFPRRSPEVARELRSASPPIFQRLATRVLEPLPASMNEVAGRYGELFLDAHRQWQAALAAGRTNGTPPMGLVDPELETFRRVVYGLDAPILPPPGRIVDLDVHLYFDDPNRVAMTTMQMGIEQFIITNRAAPPHAMILGDRPHQPVAQVFRRGDPLQRGEIAPKRFLEILAGPHRTNFTAGSGRLELARAITHPDNPLTARVMVNRVWAHHFGQGLVRTPSDFGLRCDPPTHPELLDWLARQFIAEGWSLKQMHRLLMNSAVYRQASPVPDPAAPEAFARDLDNRLLGRCPRQRLDLEAFRASLLAVGGDLDVRMGGPAEPLQSVPFSRRRTVFGLIDRKQLPGLMRAFDFANPDTHSPARHTTTMPQQALFLLNHPLIAERARRLAARLSDWPADAGPERLQALYQLVFQRPPTASEIEDSRAFLAESVPIPTEPPARTPPLAPWEALAQVLLLSNEFSFVD